MKKIFVSLFALILVATINAQNQAPNVPTVSTAGTLTISAKVTYTNPYFYAVWVNNTSGTFLRTITMYGNNTSYYADLTHWNTESGRNKVNAVTGATQSSTMTFTSTWNGTDQANSAIVADGTYPVKIEMTSENYGTSSKYISTSITKGPAAQTVTPTAVAPISAITLTWSPVSTGVETVEYGKLYNVYPNPAVNSIYATGNSIKGLQVCTLAGKILLSSKESWLNIDKLPKGYYLVVVYAKEGMVVKKIEKL